MEWFRNLNARPRVMLSMGFILVLFLCISYLAVAELGKSNQQVETLYGKDLQGTLQIDNIIADRFSMAKSNRQAILDMKDPVKLAADEATTEASIADIHASLDRSEKLFYTEAGQALLTKIRNGMPAYESANRSLMAHVKAKDFAGAKAALDQVATAGKPISDAAAAARLQKEGVAKSEFELNVHDYETSRAVILATAATSLVLGVLLSLLLARGFSIPLGMAVEALEKLAEGDLTVALGVHTRDEVGRMAVALNHALGKLRSTLQTVADSASATHASTDELTVAAEAISSGSQRQAASLEETSASLEQITAAVRLSADNAKQADQLATGSVESAQRGQDIVIKAVAAMEEINVASSKISDIISTVNDIAFQTNLLAVNAAVEAARAGDEGRGFAVVAAEVRSLAVRSAGAAKEIKLLIQDTLSKVEKGTELVNLSGKTLQTIVTSVKSVTGIVGEISGAAEEQSTGIDQVNQAVTEIDRVTQSNSAQTEELSATAQTLSEQSLHLTELIGFFKLTDGTDGRLAPARRSTPARRQVSSTPTSGPALVLAGAGGGSDFEEF